MGAPPLASPLSFSQRLAERERGFIAPEPLASPLEQVRRFLREELAEDLAETLPLARAGLVLAAAWEGEERLERLIPLAAGMEMIYYALTMQQSAVRPGEPADLFGILSHDLVLARALDLYATDGDARLMEAVSQGSSRLCEALMADRSEANGEAAEHYLARFHAACVKVGAAAAKLKEEQEREKAKRVEAVFSLLWNRTKETASLPANKDEEPCRLFTDFLCRWQGTLPQET